METSALARSLKEACERAGEREKVVTIHLFGITHASELQNASLKDVVAEAGLSAPYATELRKGMNLAKYVRAL